MINNNGGFSVSSVLSRERESALMVTHDVSAHGGYYEQNSNLNLSDIPPLQVCQRNENDGLYRSNIAGNSGKKYSIVDSLVEKIDGNGYSSDLWVYELLEKQFKDDVTRESLREINQSRENLENLDSRSVNLQVMKQNEECHEPELNWENNDEVLHKNEDLSLRKFAAEELDNIQGKTISKGHDEVLHQNEDLSLCEFTAEELDNTQGKTISKGHDEVLHQNKDLSLHKFTVEEPDNIQGKPISKGQDEVLCEKEDLSLCQFSAEEPDNIQGKTISKEHDEVLWENDDLFLHKFSVEEPGNIQGKTISKGRVVDLRMVTQNRNPEISNDRILSDLGCLKDVRRRLGPLQGIKKGVRKYASPGKKKSVGKELEVDKMRVSISGLPENGEEFEHLVNVAYLKFIKKMNKHSSQQRKFKEKGKGNILKCSVCGSNSKEFVDTLSLAQHAVMCQKLGLRAEHLGLHRALCTLMGWEASKPKDLWVRQILPDSEALALKEDLIIWPPVVFIHNSSLPETDLDKQAIASTQQLEASFKGLGIDQGMSKISVGEGESQSIMVVKFHGTLSGLQEAERLHRFFSDNKRGRTELQEITCGRDECSQKAEKLEDSLYGYLGIAEDIHKLDFETKRRCLVKSKMEIQSIANAPIL